MKRRQRQDSIFQTVAIQKQREVRWDCTQRAAWVQDSVSPCTCGRHPGLTSELAWGEVCRPLETALALGMSYLDLVPAFISSVSSLFWSHLCVLRDTAGAAVRTLPFPVSLLLPPRTLTSSIFPLGPQTCSWFSDLSFKQNETLPLMLSASVGPSSLCPCVAQVPPADQQVSHGCCAVAVHLPGWRASSPAFLPCSTRVFTVPLKRHTCIFKSTQGLSGAVLGVRVERSRRLAWAPAAPACSSATCLLPPASLTKAVFVKGNSVIS